MPAPPLRSVLRVVVACLTLTTTVGVILGFQALKKLLLAEGAYGCTETQLSCAPAHAQFLTALTLLNVCCLPVTWCAQRRPVLTSMVGGYVASAGYLLMMLANVGGVSAFYFIGYQVIGIGGVCMSFGFVSYLTVFPGFGDKPWSTIINNVLPMTFDFSAMLFQVWKWLYEIHGVSFVALCIGTACIPATLALAMPWVFADVEPLVAREGVAALLEDDSDEGSKQRGDDDPRASDSDGGLCSPLVGLLVVWAMLMMTCKYWWFDNVQRFMEWRLGDEEEARHLYDAFNIALPLASAAMLLTTPLLSWSIPAALVIMGLLSCAVGLLTAASSVPLQATNVGVVIFNRYFFFASQTTTLIELFGGAKGGSLISFILLCGSLSTLAGIGLDALVRSDSDYYWINLPLNCVAGAWCMLVGAAVGVHIRRSAAAVAAAADSAAAGLPPAGAATVQYAA